MVGAAWQHLARYGAMAQAVSEVMNPEAVARPITPRTNHRRPRRARQREGSFRTDVPAGWLVTACIALIHTCADEVRAGRIDDRDAA
jgi:hypothetical protein